MATVNASPSRPSAMDRFLRLFADVRAGESATALLLGFNVFMVLSAYYVAKVLREPLILVGGGAEVKSYAAAGQAVLLLVLVPLYGALAGRMPRRKLINVVTGFFVACLTVFFLLMRIGVPIGVPFFLWVGIFNVMIVAQFWSFANDVYSEDEGKRLFPLVQFGASSGAVVGSWLPGLLIESVGLNLLFLLSAALLLVAAVITNVVDTIERRRTETTLPEAMSSGFLPAATGQFRTQASEVKGVYESEAYQKASGSLPAITSGGSLAEAEREQVESTGGAFQLVFRNRYLLLIALLVLFLNWVNTTGEYILSSIVADHAAATVAAGAAGELSVGDLIGQFYSDYFAVVNVVGLLVQLFVVSRIVKYFGVRTGLLVLPVIALAGNLLVALVPVLGIVRWVKTAENSTDYSLNNTVRAMLFLPTTREEKYKAKQVVDSLAQRVGDMLQAGVVWVGTTFLAFEVRHFAMVNVVLILIWLALAVAIGVRYGALATATADQA